MGETPWKFESSRPHHKMKGWPDLSSVNKQIINNMLNEIPEHQLNDVIQFLFFIKKKCELNEFTGLQAASQTSTEFWNNATDDEVWNDV